MPTLNLRAITEESLTGFALKGELFNNRIFLVKDTGVDPKIFHVWKSKGLLDFLDRGEWGRLSFIEYLWVRVLETLRKLGCSVKLMKDLYDYFYTRAFKEKLGERNTRLKYEHYKNLSEKQSLNLEQAQILQALEDLIRYPIPEISKNNGTSYFYELVLQCLDYKTEAGIIIYEDKSFVTFPDYQGNVVIDYSKPHIKIPISSYILDFINDEEKHRFLAKTGLLSEDEYRVIREIKNKNVKSIKIIFNDDGKHSIQKIECDKKGVIQGDDAKKIMHLLGLKNYSGIELSTRDGSTLSFVHTEKKFF